MHHVDRAIPFEKIWQAMEQLTAEALAELDRIWPGAAPQSHAW